MKACWMLCLVTALSASAAWAESPLQSLQFEQQKQQVLKAVKEKCAPASTLSDTDFANKILASKDNQSYVREATLAKELNNQKGYLAAIDKIRCPGK
ncbi:YicS family protein [Klebsiella aerogenes]|uniref:YicS family protein n=1 Tax=Klebsiella aerogenes TaxID=548 RepID=UPI002A4E2C61|nr:YicS family protein [Klebsiella aerogenes]